MLAASSPHEDEDSVDCALTSRTRKSEEGCDAVSPTLCPSTGCHLYFAPPGDISTLRRRVFLPWRGRSMARTFDALSSWRCEAPAEVDIEALAARAARRAATDRSACRRCRRHRQRERPKHRGRPGRPAGGPALSRCSHGGPGGSTTAWAASPCGGAALSASSAFRAVLIPRGSRMRPSPYKRCRPGLRDACKGSYRLQASTDGRRGRRADLAFRDPGEFAHKYLTVLAGVPGVIHIVDQHS